MPSCEGSGSYVDSRSQPRLDGSGDVASVPSITNCHSSSGVRTPPGKRQLMATIAIGSSSVRDGAPKDPPPGAAMVLSWEPRISERR
ncbi:hypothetical protein GCM10009575_091450 [Streptomyces rhizosphaericus]|uniref:Uncharacterized protein n=1 Tax=Streptomyces rhizosphaericus TaxID=114699 RepID=A0ABN1RKS9_9ACTN